MKCILLIAMLLASSAISTTAHPGEAFLRWDPPVQSDGTPTPNIAGYSVSIGTSPGTYSLVIPVGNVTSYTVTGLLEGNTYYFATKAQDAQGSESTYSNEVSKLIPAPIVNYSIAASGGLGGSISPAGSITVASGGTQNFSIVPTTGYRISSVLVDGTSVGAIGYYSFTNVTRDHTIAASFAALGYTISASAGYGGSISPAGTVSVPPGESKTFQIKPTKNYAISSLVVDGVSKGPSYSYTFTNVTGNHTIRANFTKRRR